MHYLVIDRRFPAPVHVFLETDPRDDTGFPVDLSVRRVTLDETEVGAGGYAWTGPSNTIAQSPFRADRFRQFTSDGAAAEAGFGVIEPRYVGRSWSGYSLAFGFGAKRVRRG